MSIWEQLKIAFEWGQLARFLKINRTYVVAYIIISIIADLSLILGPGLVLLTVTNMGAVHPPSPGAWLAPILEPEIALPLALLAMILSQGLMFLRIVLIRKLDTLYFQAESLRILESYNKTNIYRREYGPHIRRIWFSKNISRNVRHTSEAMQAQLKMVPDLISLIIVLGLLGIANTIALIAVIPALILSGLLLTSLSSRIFQISRKHFSIILPAFTTKLSSVLGKAYRTHSEFGDADSIAPEFDNFLNSRYTLNVQRAYFAVYSSITISVLLISIIFITMMLNKYAIWEQQLSSDQLLLQVILLLQIMNKSRGLLGGIGSISSLYPQIKMLREIDGALEQGQQTQKDLDEKATEFIWSRLPLLLHFHGNGKLTRFNISYLLEEIATQICSGTPLPSSQYVSLSNANLKENLSVLNLELAPDKLVLRQLIDAWTNRGKRVFLVDWKLLSEFTAGDLARLREEDPEFRIVLSSRASIPQKWLNALEHAYLRREWSDPFEVSDYGKPANYDIEEGM